MIEKSSQTPTAHLASWACLTLRVQLDIQWTFQMGFGHQVCEVTVMTEYFAMFAKCNRSS